MGAVCCAKPGDKKQTTGIGELHAEA